MLEAVQQHGSTPECAHTVLPGNQSRHRTTTVNAIAQAGTQNGNALQHATSRQESNRAVVQAVKQGDSSIVLEAMLQKEKEKE